MSTPSFGLARPSLTVTNWLPARPSAGPHLTVPSNNNGEQRQHCLDNGSPDKLGSLYSPFWLHLLFPSCCLAVLYSGRTGVVGAIWHYWSVCILVRSNLLHDTCCHSYWQNTQIECDMSSWDWGTMWGLSVHSVPSWVEDSGPGREGAHTHTHSHRCTHTVIPNQMWEEERERSHREDDATGVKFFGRNACCIKADLQDEKTHPCVFLSLFEGRFGFILPFFSRHQPVTSNCLQ